MVFASYTDARRFFQQNINWLDTEKLSTMVIELKRLQSVHLYLREKIQITDLIIDVEHQIDLLNNPDLLIHLRKKNHESRIKRVTTIEKEIELPPEPKDPPSPEVIKDSPLRKKIIPEEPEGYQPFSLQIGYLDGINNLLSEIERDAIIQVLRHVKNNKSQAARTLGITVKTIYNRMERYGLLKKIEQKRSSFV